MNKTYKMTGLFVLIGIISFIGIVLNYVAKKFTTNDDDLVVMYFEESIRGLSVGSSVVFQGVEVGKVEDISLLANLKEGTFKTPVLVLFNIEDSIDAIDDVDLDDKQMMDNLIAKGLRARLVTANFLTGQLMIELIMDDKTPAVYRGTGKYWEIPTVYSPFAQISKDLEEIPLQDTIVRFGNLINKIDDNIPVILDNLNKMTEAMADSAPETMSNLNVFMDNLNKNLPELLRNMNKVAAKFDGTMDKKNGEVSKTMKNINNTLEEISKAGRSMKNLTDYLERHPEAIIQGKGK